MEYRVIDDSTEVAEFKIIVTELEKYCSKYELIAIGVEWSDEVRNHPVLTITNDGNGYIIDDKIGTDLQYHKAAYLFILLNFMNKHEGTEEYAGVYGGRIERIEIETILKM
jgi:hypothetical protein